MSLLEDMKKEVEVLSRLSHVETTTVMDNIEEVSQGEELLLPPSDPMLLALLVTSSSNLILVLLYWTHLLYSTYSNTSHTSSPVLFPHILLLGLCFGSSSSLAHVSLEPPSLHSCLFSLLLPISYSIIYSSLLVRLVYLRSLHKGVYLPSLYQALLLLFCILVQTSLTSQLVLLTRESACSPPLTSPQSHLLSLTYVFLLLLTCLGLSTLLRNTAEHYKEARALWATCLLSLASWITWVSSGLIFGHHYLEIRALGLEATVLVVLVVLLLPRDRRITYVAKEGMEEYWGDKAVPYWGPSNPGGHNQFSAQAMYPGSSYMGFHRPTRVVPPSSSSSSQDTGRQSSCCSQSRLLRSSPYLPAGYRQFGQHSRQRKQRQPPGYGYGGGSPHYLAPTYTLPLADVLSLSEKYQRYRPQYCQL